MAENLTMYGAWGARNKFKCLLCRCVTSNQRNLVASNLVKKINMELKDKLCAQTTKPRIKRDSSDRINLKNTIEQCMNPFSQAWIDLPVLLNISTGKAATQAFQNYLCNSVDESNWLTLRSKFKEECVNDPTWFLKVITQGKVYNFAKSGKKSHA